MSWTARCVAGLVLVGAMTPAAAGAADVEDVKDYVALGDSYTAGPLIPVQTPGPLGCFRSSNNYPAYLASYLDLETFTDVSCSAARSQDLRGSQTGNLPGGLPENQNAPQLLALTEETDLVTLGIGGNDFGLFGGLIDNCTRVAEENPDAEAPCKDFFTEDGVDTKIRDARAIEANIDQALRDIRARSPRAEIVLVNYLHILPETGTCAEVPFAEGDYRWGTTVQVALNESMRSAAVANGATYVDMYAASVGRDACAADPWVNGKLDIPLDLTRALNFHPFESGMKAIADTTFRTVTGQAAPAFSLPALQLVGRLPALLDVRGLLEYIASGGFVPPQVVEGLDDVEPGTPGDPADPSDPADPTDPTDPADPGDGAGDDDGDVAPVADTPASGDDGASLEASSDGWLPDAGGPTLTLVALGLGLLGAGAWLVRRRGRA